MCKIRPGAKGSSNIRDVHSNSECDKKCVKQISAVKLFLTSQSFHNHLQSDTIYSPSPRHLWTSRTSLLLRPWQSPRTRCKNFNPNFSIRILRAPVLPRPRSRPGEAESFSVSCPKIGLKAFPKDPSKGVVWFTEDTVWSLTYYFTQSYHRRPAWSTNCPTGVWEDFDLGHTDQH